MCLPNGDGGGWSSQGNSRLSHRTAVCLLHVWPAGWFTVVPCRAAVDFARRGRRKRCRFSASPELRLGLITNTSLAWPLPALRHFGYVLGVSRHVERVQGRVEVRVLPAGVQPILLELELWRPRGWAFEPFIAGHPQLAQSCTGRLYLSLSTAAAVAFQPRSAATHFAAMPLSVHRSIGGSAHKAASPQHGTVARAATVGLERTTRASPQR